MTSRRMYTAYDPPPKVRRESVGPSRTRQSEAAALDVNKIVAQFHKTGLLPQGALQGLYMDVSQVGDYRAALEQVELADKAFMTLPAQVRADFDNDPAAFLDFCSDPANRPEMVRMGLLEAEEASAAEKVQEAAKEPPVGA